MNDNRTQDQRFWPKVNKAGPAPECRPDLGSCWIWLAAKFPNGYGRSWWPPRDLLAHRVAYELAVGSISPGLVLDHLCRVRECVNPDHLEQVTQRENVMRSSNFAALNARKTHCIRGHEFTPENTRIRIAEDGITRQCRACAKKPSTGRSMGAHNAAKTHCPRNHEYSPENTIYGITPSGGPSRRCRECERARSRSRSQRPK